MGWEGMFGGLQAGLKNPMTLGGLGLLTGGGMGAMAQGVQSGQAMQKYDTEERQRAAREAAAKELANDPSAFGGLPPGFQKMITAMGPDGIPLAVQAYMKGRDNDHAMKLFEAQKNLQFGLEKQKMQWAKDLELQQAQNKWKMVQQLTGGADPSQGQSQPPAPTQGAMKRYNPVTGEIE